MTSEFPTRPKRPRQIRLSVHEKLKSTVEVRIFMPRADRELWTWHRIGAITLSHQDWFEWWEPMIQRGAALLRIQVLLDTTASTLGHNAAYHPYTGYLARKREVERQRRHAETSHIYDD